jgi:predicted RNase H-like HicB family nuclease
MGNLNIVFHETEEGGYWAEIPAMPGCITEGDTLEEAQANIREAAEVWLATKLEWILTRGKVENRPQTREMVYA